MPGPKLASVGRLVDVMIVGGFPACQCECIQQWLGAQVTLFNPTQVRTTRYRYRGAAIPAPWPASG